MADALAKVPPGEREQYAAIFKPEEKPASPDSSSSGSNNSASTSQRLRLQALLAQDSLNAGVAAVHLGEERPSLR